MKFLHNVRHQRGSVGGGGLRGGRWGSFWSKMGIILAIFGQIYAKMDKISAIGTAQCFGVAAVIGRTTVVFSCWQLVEPRELEKLNGGQQVKESGEVGGESVANHQGRKKTNSESLDELLTIN